MKYIHGTTEFHIEEECVLSLGKFDGLHRGHEIKAVQRYCLPLPFRRDRAG